VAGLPADPRRGSSGLAAIELLNIRFPHSTPQPSGATVKAVLRALGGKPPTYCAMRKIGDSPSRTAQSGGESEEGRRAAPLGRVRGEG
jgi:hypothetical protein